MRHQRQGNNPIVDPSASVFVPIDAELARYDALPAWVRQLAREATNVWESASVVRLMEQCGAAVDAEFARHGYTPDPKMREVALRRYVKIQFTLNDQRLQFDYERMAADDQAKRQEDRARRLATPVPGAPRP